MSTPPVGKVRPLWFVMFLSAITSLAYYGYYKWVIQDELRRYTGTGWSGALSMVPFVGGILIPQALRLWDPDVPGWFGWFSLVGIVWIYVVQFRLYHTVNRLYQEADLEAPLTVWWLFVPGLNLLVGLQQIHFLSEYWASKQNTTVIDPVVKALPALFASLVIAISSWAWGTAPAAAQILMPSPVLAANGSLFSFSGDRPNNLGIQAGKLAPCPNTPNCVSSQSQDSAHRIAPLPYSGDPKTALQQVKAIVESLPRTNMIQSTDQYLYAEFTSALMGFVDDVEFWVDPEASVIQVRSASRLGESDLGVNRKRIDTIRSKLAASV